MNINKNDDCKMKPCDRYRIIGVSENEQLGKNAVSLFKKPLNKKPSIPETKEYIKAPSPPKEENIKPKPEFSPIKSKPSSPQKRKGSPTSSKKSKSPKTKKNKEGGKKNTKKTHKKIHKFKKNNKTKKGGKRKCITSL